MPRQLHGDSPNTHRRMDNTPFYLPVVPRNTVPSPPDGSTQGDVIRWINLHVELYHLRHVLHIQLAPPHNSPENYHLARNFWWRVAKRDGVAKDRHTFAHQGMWIEGGNDTEGIAELVKSHPMRIADLERTVKERRSVQSSQESSRASTTSSPIIAGTQQYHAQQQQQPPPHTDPPSSAYPLSHRVVPKVPTQPHRPPFLTPRHSVFNYWGRDLSSPSRHLPVLVLADGMRRQLFRRVEQDCTDHGWGAGVQVHDHVRGDVSKIERQWVDHVIKVDEERRQEQRRVKKVNAWN